jgi:predicted enzyme related to lactoylglutathione lyase
MIDRVEPAGGRVTTGKTGDKSSGYVAFLLDTEGNKVGLHSPG